MATPPPPVGGGGAGGGGAPAGAQGGGAAGGGAGGPTFPAHFGQQSAPAFGAGAFGAAADSDGATVDSLVSQFSEINTAFDHESTLRRFCEVTSLQPDEARGLLEGARRPPTRPPARPPCAARARQPPPPRAHPAWRRSERVEPARGDQHLCRDALQAAGLHAGG